MNRSEGIFTTDVNQHDRDVMFATKTVDVLAGRNKTAQTMGNNMLPIPQDWSLSQMAIHAIAKNKVGDMKNVINFDCPRSIARLDSYDHDLDFFVNAFIAWGDEM
jgi:hypothetical protein